MLVIYTAGVKRGTTNPVLDTGSLRVEVTEAFLSGLNADEIWTRISGKVDRDEDLLQEELMELIIYPLIFMDKRDKQEALMETKIERFFHEEEAIRIAKNFLRSGSSVEYVTENTNLPKDTVIDLYNSITAEKNSK